MPGLSSKDISSFNQAILGLHATESAKELPWQIHLAIRKMMSGDLVGVNWVDPRISVSLECRYFPDGVVAEELNVLAQALLPKQSPMWLTCSEEARAASDFMSRTAWARRDLFWAMREVSLEEYLGFDIRISPSLTLIVADLRDRYNTYTTADRLKLQLLGPHLRQICQRMITRGEILAGDEPGRRLMRITVDADGRVADWPPDVRGMLSSYRLPVIQGRLPLQVLTWFLQQKHALRSSSDVSKGTQSLRIERPSRTLRVYFKPHHDGRSYHLILRESASVAATDHLFPTLGVSKREGEVLLWMTQGKTNVEIACILGVSPGTVRRHLENIFPKLGVENRHSAAMAVMQAQARRGMPG